MNFTLHPPPFSGNAVMSGEKELKQSGNRTLSLATRQAAVGASLQGCRG